MIYDIFYFYKDLDLLEIRLGTLDPVVDRFVIVEGPKRYSNAKKPLYYLENKERFKKWNSKIIPVFYDAPDDFQDQTCDPHIMEMAMQSPTTGDFVGGRKAIDNFAIREFYIKEYVRKFIELLPDDDWCIISDADEIWNPELPIEQKEGVFKYKLLSYMYYLNQRSDQNHMNWTGPTACRAKILKEGCINDILSHKLTPYTLIENGGWHFSWQGGVEALKDKMNHPAFMNRSTVIEQQINENKDWLGNPLHLWIDETDHPQWLKDNRDKFTLLYK